MKFTEQNGIKMSDLPKTVEGWMIFRPITGYNFQTFQPTEQAAISRFLAISSRTGPRRWAELRSQGFRCIKVQIEALEESMI